MLHDKARSASQVGSAGWIKLAIRVSGMKSVDVRIDFKKRRAERRGVERKSEGDRKTGKKERKRKKEHNTFCPSVIC